MADVDYDRLQKAFENALSRASASGAFKGSNNSGGSSGSVGGSTGGGGPSNNVMNQANSTVTKLTQGFDSLQGTISNVVGSIDHTVNVFRNLSNSGANFSNDIIGMSVSARQSRLNLDDFAGIIRDNGKDLAGLGGSVSRGTEVFSNFSKQMFESGAADQLRFMGLTTKEVNETLALNLGFQRATAGTTKEAQAFSANKARELAMEMDALAKLTGKSRDEQKRALDQAKADAAIEAKMRLIGLKEGPEAESKARASFAKQYAQAEAMGMGQLAKDMFTKGFPATEESRMQYALMGQAAAEVGNSMQSLAKGQIEEAESSMKRASTANAANQMDETLLQLGTLGSVAGKAGEAVQVNIKDNMSLTDSVRAVADANGILLNSQKDYARALDLVRSDIEKSQAGFKARRDEKTGQIVRDEKGKIQYDQVGGVTRGVIAPGIMKEEVLAGAAEAAELIAKNSKLYNLGSEVGKAVPTVRQTVSDLGKQVKDGISTKPVTTEPTTAAGKASEDLRTGGAIGAITRGVTGALSTLNDIAIYGVQKILINNVEIPAKGVGGVVTTPQLNIVGEAGPETIIPNKDIDNVIKSAVSRMPPPVLDMPTMPKEIGDAVKQVNSSVQGIDLSKVTKDISISMGSMISQLQTPTLKTIQQPIEINEAQPNYVSEQQVKLDTVNKVPTLDKPYENLINSLKKNIEDSVNFEINLKNNQTNEIKKAAIEQENIVKIANEKITNLEQVTASKLIDMTVGKSAELFKNAENISTVFDSMVPGMSAVTEKLVNENKNLIDSLVSGASSTTITSGDTDRENKKIANQAAAIRETIPETVSGTLDLNRISIGSDGLPTFKNVAASPKEQTQSKQSSVDQKVSSVEEKKTIEKQLPNETGKKQVSLSEVVEALNRVNSQLTTLVSITEDIGDKQLRATKANNNLHKV